MTQDELKKQVAAQIAAVKSVLRKWDPIGILPGEFGPADEYDSYAPRFVSLVRGGCRLDELALHLTRIRTGTIGLESDDAADLQTASEIVSLFRDDASSSPTN